MDEIASVLDPEDLMDLDEGEGSDLDEEEDDLIDDPLPSPFPFPTSAPESTVTSAASSPLIDDFSIPFNFSGKPLSIKRGRGRPRREGGKPAQRRASFTNRPRKIKQPGLNRAGISKKIKMERLDYDCVTPSPSEDLMIDPETGAFVFIEKEKPMPIVEELPYFPEQWTGKVCAYCNLGERSQLGQGEMLRLLCPEGFIPERVASDNTEVTTQTPEREFGDKSPRGPVTCRRQKSFNKCRHPSLTSEYVDELTIIGYNEEPHVTVLFDASGYFYTHRNCAMWSSGVIRNEETTALENVGPVVLQSSSKKCSYCNHYGASICCKIDGCAKVYHYPCATASGAFQVLNTLALYCCNHLGQASLDCEFVVCYTCKTLGDIGNLMYCSSCGEHYHGTCVGLAQLPGVRAGWQCRKCRICQVCHVTGDETKLMTCEQCDKVYHSTCQRPIVATIPKYGWKCRCCRVCGDCGSRTPGAGLSSRWHAHYTVCDSCYQQRNKGYNCPLCRRAYRAHAHREMVMCTSCRKFVHGSCDPDAELATYQQRKEAHPEYEYVCLYCKNSSQAGQLVAKRNSVDDLNDCLNSSQESPYEDAGDFDVPFPMEGFRSLGLGKGKPYSASKIAKKRLGLSVRPKGVGKGMPGKVSYMKRNRLTDFGRKRGAKAKMRGVFGVPGVGLQRPVGDGRNDEEPGLENRLVLCSAKDKFVLTQDICLMCGALGTDQEGCLISCVQCGQCYHPYCVSVKVTKVILQKGWRCLDCTVCEGCGQRNDEARLILCDECDISYHIYCMDPPLDYVPHGNWKCKWCAICQVCGATDPGFNCTWMNSFSECGPCASQVTCPSCSEPYGEGDLIMQCVQCERWLHGACDNIRSEEDAEKCAEDGYNCLLCRPRDVPPPHLIAIGNTVKPPTPTKSPEMKSNNQYYVDGVYLSESGHNLIKSLSIEQNGTRKKRKKLPTVQDKEAGIMATIESVVAGNSTNNMLDDSAKLELVDVKDEPQEMYKEGMIWIKDDGPPPEGFTVYTMENGSSVLRRKRQRNLQKLGIGGFLVRMRKSQDNEDVDTLPGHSGDLPMPMVEGDKPRRKPVRRKPKSKLAESFPPYIQEAFFGRELLDCTKEMDNSSGEEDKGYMESDKTIQLTQDEIKAVAAVSAKQEINIIGERLNTQKAPLLPKVEDEEEAEDLKDVLAIPGDLLDTDLVNTIMNEGDGELSKNNDTLDALTGAAIPEESDLASSLGTSGTVKDTKDELSDILGHHFNLESMPNINSKDVEDIFKDVLTDDSQESQERVFPMQSNNFNSGAPVVPQPQQLPVATPPIRPSTLPNINQNSLNSPLNFPPPPSPYQSEYSNSPQFSPAFSEPPSPWVSANDSGELEAPPSGVQSTYNQRSSEKMKADEALGNGATISAVLYANMNHPEWKTEYVNWNERYKQILKKWRTLSPESKAPYLQQARDNRSALRMKKQQQSQMNKEGGSSIVVSSTTTKPSISTNQQQQQPQQQPSPIQQQLVAIQQQQQQQPQQPQPSPSIIPTAAAALSGHVISNMAVVAAAAAAAASQQQQHVVTEDQEKVSMQHKSAREAEQERQWKQLQALRQQQAQMQQNVIHEQRLNARVQRQISEPNPSTMVQEQSPQELSPVAPPSPNPRQFIQMAMKPTTFTHPAGIRPQVPPPQPTPQPPVDFPQVQDPIDPYAKQPATPKLVFQQRLPADPYAQQPSTPRPQFPIPRPPLQGPRPQLPDNPEKHLRDLLQKQQQQFKKLDDQIVAGKGQQRVWPPQEMPQPEEGNTSASLQNSAEATFRQPLPPGVVRTRMPVPVRQPLLGIRMQTMDPRIQNLDPRMRLLIQQQQQQRLVLQPGQQPQEPVFQGVRFAPGGGNIIRAALGPGSVEQYEQLLQRQQLQQQARLPQPQQPQMNRSLSAPATTETPQAATEQEIPDNVTAELEKLEQETGQMVELQGVSDILGGLGEDDDELLAEMGADFNILEYADPEALPGEKTNILDLELEEEPIKNEKKKVEAAAGKPVRKETVTPAVAPPQQPPPLAMPQQPQVQLGSAATQMTPQQIHQQMLFQVQQAAAHGKPMAIGSKLQTPEGIVGIVKPNNNVQLQVPQSYHQRLLATQLQNQKLQLRLGQNVPRMMVPSALNPTPRLAAPPPPPPPYPGPPPPYPGSSPQQQPQQMQQQQQMGLRMGPYHLPLGHNMHPMCQQGLPLHPHHLQRRPPLLLEEQPLLLEDLLEQEKREQEKQSQQTSQEVTTPSSTTSEPSAFLSDHDFERLRADVFSGMSQSTRPAPATVTSPQSTWQQNQNRVTPQPVNEVRVQTFNANLVPPPPLPPENIVTEQDKQKQMLYEQWLTHQNNVLVQQLRFYETEVNKLRKIRKSLNSKQRQLKKTGSQLAEADASELQRISSEQAILQKQLELSRKSSRQHGLLIQEYRNKQQAKQPMLQQNSPLGQPSSSPIQQSPMMSPSASPLTQHNSPMHSPGPMVSPSNILQSPNSINTMSPMQQSPRIGTPHSQGDGSPGPVQSPSQVCLPPPAPRMTSPQHKRVVTSPVGYSPEMRPCTPQMRFVRTPGGRLQSPMMYQQKPGTPSPLSSPPPQDPNVINSQKAAQLIQQRNFVRQQIANQQQQAAQQPQPLTAQQHQLMVQQQQQLAKQQQHLVQLQQQQQRLAQQPTSPMPPKSPLVQQIMSPHSMPASPMPPRSPMMTSFNTNPNSPRTFQPPSPMHQYQQPPSSPMIQMQQPPSPMLNQMPSSPMLNQLIQPPSSPMISQMSQQPTSPMLSQMSPARRPPSTGPSYQHEMQQGGGGGGNPNNPIPAPACFGRFGYFKLGLRGGSPMWSFGRGAKRIPTPPKEAEKPTTSTEVPVKPKKESHLSRVSILKRHSPAKTNLQTMGKLGSLVSTDYNDFDDSSCTPPVTPPPSTSRAIPQKKAESKLAQQTPSPEEEEKLQCGEMMDYEEDDNTVISGEISLSAAAQQGDGDDIAVIETFSQSDLGETMSSPLESDQIPDEYLLFPSNMVVDISTENSDKEVEEEEAYSSVVIRSPTTSDDEYIMQNKTKKYNIIHAVESPEADEGSGDEEEDEGDIVIIDPSMKSPEEQISTKEDFEELIDENKKEKIVKPEVKHINEIHKYAANIFTLPKSEQTAATSKVTNIFTSKIGQKISLIAPTVVTVTKTNSDAINTQNATVTSTPKLANIILHNAIGRNVLNVPKLVTSTAITIVSGNQTGFTVPVLSASAVRQLPNVKVIDKPSSSISLTTHDSRVPKKIFEDDSVSPDSSNCEDNPKSKDADEKSKSEVIKDSLEQTSSCKPTEVHPEPVRSQVSSPVIIHNAPELKMTAQIIQESQSGMQISAHTENVDDNSHDDTKSVVISIPSPTPSQEQMLDNIARQALENRRRDNNGISEFESFEDVLDMIENITGEPPTVLEQDEKNDESQSDVKSVPQLSPLSQPADLTTNMANASQQLRTLLSSLQTSSAASTTNVESVAKSNVTTEANQAKVSSVIVPNAVVSTPVSYAPNRLAMQLVTEANRQTLQLVTEASRPMQMMADSSMSLVHLPDSSRQSISGLQSMLDSNKINMDAAKIAKIITTQSQIPKTIASVMTTQNERKSCSLSEMLDSLPAAAPTSKPTTDVITVASLLGTSVSLSRTGFNTSLVQAQPHVVVSPATQSQAITTNTPTAFKPVTSTTNLLHTQLTKVMRTKSLDEDKSEEIKMEEAKIRNEDSQNALLKKLLQNAACAPVSSQPAVVVAAPPAPFTTTVAPTLSSILPVPKHEQIVTTSKPQQFQRTVVMTRETSFVSGPPAPNQQLHIDIKRGAPPSRTPSRDDLLSPQTPRSSCSQDSSLQTPPLIVKKEIVPEVKREDETSQHSEVSDQSRSDVQIKEELDSLLESEKLLLEKEELKRQKRRMYQQKRRQNQIMNKELAQPKKRARKNSKAEEDYDTYIEGVMAQLRTLPPMIVSEPVLKTNYGIVPIFGSNMSKIVPGYNTRFGELTGRYGNATLPDYTDFYSTQPYSDLEALPEKPPVSTQRGFYDQEFPPIKFDEDEKRFDLFSRDDTPDSIVSSSSPECVLPEPPHKFFGLKLIDEDEDEEEEESLERAMKRARYSPVVPIITPIPIRLKPTGQYIKDPTDDKENVGVCTKSKFGATPSTPLKDSGNVTVTLTLTSSAAEDILGVLRDLANILHIPAPTSYQIVERTGTPPSQKLGLYRPKGKDGKEGTPVDIQSILNGAAKFCKHCDVVILNNMIRKKVSELPFLNKDSELLSDGDELYFCSTTCYMQFALMHRSPSIPEEKAAAIVDHLCQRDKVIENKQKKHLIDNLEMEFSFLRRGDDVKTNIKSEGDTFNMKSGEGARKVWKGSRYKNWVPGCLQPITKYKKLTDKDIMEMLYRMGITVTPPKVPDDIRKCMFCQNIGDGVADGPARLLNYDVDKWIHLNCGLWSDGVYETVNGALMNLENALQQSLNQTCVNCNRTGATVRCFKTRCSNIYHLSCAVKDGCVFYKNKTTYCSLHVPKNEKDNELTTLSVWRRVYVNRDENRQVAAVMHHSDTSNLLRVGSLIFLNVGQLLPHQLQNFHTPNYIYPIGYKIIRFYWSMRQMNKRCRYICSIHESFGRPEFKVVVQEPPDEDVEFKDSSPKLVWHRILDQISSMRRENQCVQVFPKFVTGEDLFGLTEPAVVRVLESLPGVETLTDYKFKYGRNPLLELPLAINPSGAARTEPKLRNQLHWKRPHTQRTAGASVRPIFGPLPSLTSANLGEVACPYSKQFVHSKSSQYKKMKQEWRNNVYLARSKIQGLGLYAARDLDKHTMVIEYIGEIIRTELAETREKAYEARNRGIYMFRLDEDRVVDATLCGGLARYINHSCNPNCVAETVEVDRDYRIIIFAKRRIHRGEELAYDYKFDIEDDQHKIPCMCGAPNCRKWMN